MGYYSEVAIAIAKEPKNLWPEFKAGFESALAKETNGKKSAVEEFFTAGCMECSDHYYLYAHSVKWYVDRPTVAFVEDWMAKLDEAFRWEDYAFCRIGEELEDNEEKGCLDRICISRSVYHSGF